MDDVAPDNDIGRRLQPRVPASLLAHLVMPHQRQCVFIESISCSGAGLAVELPLAVGSEVVLSWEAFDMAGMIVWTRGRRCGLAFSEELPGDILAAVIGQSNGEKPAFRTRSIRQRNLR